MKCGIYKITNIKNGKVYIGQSIDIEERWRQHKKDCNRRNQNLYLAFRKYGLDSFYFEVLEETIPDRNLMAERESYYIHQYDSIKNGYNESEPELSVGILNRLLTDEEVLQIRTERFKGSKWQDTYAIVDNKITAGGFMSIWNGVGYPHILKELYTEENLSKLRHEKKLGGNNPKAKLAEQDVINIRLRKKNGEAFRFVFADYSERISYSGMRQVWGGQSWKHVVV